MKHASASDQGAPPLINTGSGNRFAKMTAAELIAKLPFACSTSERDAIDEAIYEARNREQAARDAAREARKAATLATALRPLLTVVHNDQPGPAAEPIGVEAEPASRELVSTDPSTLESTPVPDREWIIRDWLGVGYVTGQYADGGVGKSLIAQSLQTATATGTAWLGYAVTPCCSIGLFCEDDEGELHRRQARINQANGVSFCDLGAMRWISGVGQDNTFCSFDRQGRMIIHDRYEEIAELVRDHAAKLIVLDNVADLFGGNENDRNQVRRFINLLNGLALDRGAAVLLNCHPSRAGLSGGSLDGGSTAWSNSMRSRWTVARVKDDAGTDTGERVISVAKSNYSKDGETIRLRFDCGALVPITRPSGTAAASERDQAERVFLTLLDRCGAQNLFVSESRHAANYAPKIFAARPDREGISRKQFEVAMSALFADEKITIEEYLRCRKPARRIARSSGSEGAE